MEHTSTVVFAGIDTHADVHHVAVIDADGRPLADQPFDTTRHGLERSLMFISGCGSCERVGIEGTGSYGAGISTFFGSVGVAVVEVDRPNRKARRDNGKSDTLDAYAAADAVRTGRATTPPKDHTGAVEQLRMLKIVRTTAIQTRTQAKNQITALLTNAPTQLRDRLRRLEGKKLINVLAALRPGAHNTTENTAKQMLRQLAHRWLDVDAEDKTCTKQINRILKKIAPELLAVNYVGPQTATQLLITAGDNPDRLTKGEAALAHLAGVAPIPASSGKTHRHRLNRAGDRQANSAFWRIAFLRYHHDPQTKAYVQKRINDGLSEKDILRCLKRYIVRAIYPILNKIINRQNQQALTA